MGAVGPSGARWRKEEMERIRLARAKDPRYHLQNIRMATGVLN
jgi:hypothetical protein